MTLFQIIFFVGLFVGGATAYFAAEGPVRERLIVVGCVAAVVLCLYGTIMSVTELLA